MSEIPEIYDRAAQATIQDEADSFVQQCMEEFARRVDPFVGFQEAELESITRKNIVVHAVKFGPEVLAHAELLYKMKNPLR